MKKFVGIRKQRSEPRDPLEYESAAAGLALLPPVAGGATRQESVRSGLEALASFEPSHVLIHDAARPFVDDSIITRVLEALDRTPAAIAAVPVADTLKRGEGALISATVERKDLWRAQTPQGFHYRAILEAHRKAAAEGNELTDDAAVAERAGMAVTLVMGSEDNFKVTAADDLKRAERLVQGGGEIHTGLGFDAHRFAPGDRIWGRSFFMFR